MRHTHRCKIFVEVWILTFPVKTIGIKPDLGWRIGGLGHFNDGTRCMKFGFKRVKFPPEIRRVFPDHDKSFAVISNRSVFYKLNLLPDNDSSGNQYYRNRELNNHHNFPWKRCMASSF